MSVGAAPRWRWLDLRLVPAAAGIWATTLGAPLARPALLGWICALGCVLGVLLGRRRGPVAAVLLTLVAAVSVASAAATDRKTSPSTPSAASNSGCGAGLTWVTGRSSVSAPPSRPTVSTPALRVRNRTSPPSIRTCPLASVAWPHRATSVVGVNQRSS